MKRSLAVIAVVVLLLLWIGGSYNRLVALNENVDARWAQVQTQYQRRLDLIPNLVRVVEQFQNFERDVLNDLAEARTRYAGSTTVDEQVQATNQVESALARLLVIVENYPDLKSSEQFIRLQDELAGTENRIAVERQRYNEAVQTYNAVVKRFPTALYARMLGFGERRYFESSPGAENAPQVNFGS